MSRDRTNSSADRMAARRRGGGEDGSSVLSPRARFDSHDDHGERLDRAERIEAERQEQLQAEEEAKLARRKARSAARKAAAALAAEAESGATASSTAASSPAADDDDEEAARLARRAARRAARAAAAQAAQAAEDAPSSSPRPSDSIRQSDIVRDVFDQSREEMLQPRFQRPIRKEPEEEPPTPTTGTKPRRKVKREDGEDEVVSPRRKASVNTEATPNKPIRSSSAAEDRSSNTTTAGSFSTPSTSKPLAARPSRRPIQEEVEEVEQEAEEEKENTSQIETLRSPGLHTRSDSNNQLPMAGSSFDNNVDRARITAIAAAQKSLDVAGLNRVLKNVPPVFFQKENFNPFNHWNDAKEQLEEWMAYVDSAVEKVVDAYHKGFNTATSSFSHVLEKFSESQKLVKKVQDNLVESKRLLQSRNQNLKDYYFQNRMTSKMKDILEKIEYVIEIPAWIDFYMSRKQYVHVVVLLQSTLSLLVSDDLVGIEGLLELREEILMRKHFVAQFLIEELHRILYMKDRDSNAHLKFISKSSRDQALSGGAQQEPVLSFNADGTRVVRPAPIIDTTANRSPTLIGVGGPSTAGQSSSASSSTQSRPTPADSKYSPFYTSSSNFSLDQDEATNTAERLSPALRALLKDEAQDNYVKNPEANANKFLGLLVSALDHMNHLPSVKTQVNKRVRSELLAIITHETSIQKEKSKFSMPRRILARATESGYLTQGSEILIELCERIFYILTHVLKNHLDVINMIQSRIGTSKTDGGRVSEAESKFSIEGVWSVIQIVLQTTLTDYLHALTDSGRSAKTDIRSTATKKGKKPVVQDLLNDLTFSFEDSSATSVAKLSRGDKVQQTQYRAKAPTTEGTNGTTTNGFGEANQASNWIQPTPYNITAVYRPVVNFTDHANSLIRGSSSSSHDSSHLDDPLSDSNQLRNFLKIFIEVSFLPRVEADVNIRLDEVLNDPSAFDARELQRDSRYSYGSAGSSNITHAAGSSSISATAASILASATHTSTVSPPLRSFPCAELEHNLLFKCILDISDVLKKNFQDMYLLPHSIPEYLKIIESSLNRVLEKCYEKYMNELVKSANTPQGCTPTPQQLLLTSDEKLLSLLEDDPFLKILRMGESNPVSSAMAQSDFEDELIQYFSPINPIYTAFFQRASRFDRSQLQFDMRIWSQLSLMAESLEWISDRIYHCNVFSPELSKIWQDGEGQMAGTDMRGFMRAMAKRPGKFGSRHGGPRLESFRVHHYLERKRHGETPAAMTKYLAGKSLLDQKRWTLAEHCLQLADRCLFTLRLELHSHIFFYLKEMQSGAYWCANDSTEPEPFVLELNRDLTLIDEAVSKYLATPKKKYVFGGCCELMTNLLVKTLVHLQDKRVNSKGVSKIVRNFFALQQNLNNIEGATTNTTITQSTNPGSPIINTNQHLQESHFDRARQYYELLNCTQEDLHLFQLENPDMFSADEYAALMTIHTQTRMPDARFS